MFVLLASHLQRLNLLNDFYFDKADYYFWVLPIVSAKNPVKFRKIYLYLQMYKNFRISIFGSF